MATNSEPKRLTCRKCGADPSRDPSMIVRVNPIGELPAVWECRPACGTATATIDCMCPHVTIGPDTLIRQHDAACPHKPLPVLHAVQTTAGYVPPATPDPRDRCATCGNYGGIHPPNCAGQLIAQRDAEIERLRAVVDAVRQLGDTQRKLSALPPKGEPRREQVRALLKDLGAARATIDRMAAQLSREAEKGGA